MDHPQTLEFISMLTELTKHGKMQWYRYPIGSNLSRCEEAGVLFSTCPIMDKDGMQITQLTICEGERLILVIHSSMFPSIHNLQKEVEESGARFARVELDKLIRRLKATTPVDTESLEINREA